MESNRISGKIVLLFLGVIYGAVALFLIYFLVANKAILMPDCGDKLSSYWSSCNKFSKRNEVFYLVAIFCTGGLSVTWFSGLRTQEDYSEFEAENLRHFFLATLAFVVVTILIVLVITVALFLLEGLL